MDGYDLSNASLDFFREWLRERCEILGAVSLHPYAFLPHTGVKTCVLFLARLDTGQNRRSRVFFAISTRPGKDSAGRFEEVDGAATYGRGDDLQEIAERFRSFLDSESNAEKDSEGRDVSVAAVTVPRTEIVHSRRLDPEYYDPEVLQLLHRLEAIGAVSLGSLTRQPHGWKRRKAGLIDYVDISAVDNSTGEALPTEMDVADAPTRASYLAVPGDVLVSTVRPDRNTVGLISSASDHELVASNGFCVLRPVGIASEVLFAYCKTRTFRKLVTRAATATMYPAVADRDVLDVPMPRIPIEAEQVIVRTLRDAQSALREGRRLLAEAVERMEGYVQEALGGEVEQRP